MKTLIDKKKMSGRQLFEYYTGRKSKYSVIVQMLVYATQNIEKAYEILERCERENKSPFPFYPGIGRDTRISEDELNSFEYVGDIIDGEMYLVPSDWLIKNNLIDTPEL